MVPNTKPRMIADTRNGSITRTIPGAVSMIPAARRSRMVLLTTSREESDRVETFKLSVAGYMIKPADYLQFVEVVRTIDLYWTLSELSD